MLKKTLIGFYCLVLFYSLSAQPEIDCNLVHTDPALSTYVLPYPIGKTYTVSQSNCHPFGGHYLTFAYDFNTAIGDTIVACRAGEVIFTNDQYADTDWTSGHENNVFIEHSDGTRIRYTHLQQGGTLVTAGQQVQAGQPIGLSGNSGATGGFPHLHLAAFQDGSSYGRKNTIPLNFSNTEDPLSSQNLLIEGQSYTALDYTSTAINPPIWQESIRIYPNPAREVLNLRLSDFSIKINKIELYSLQGTKVFQLGQSLPQELIQIPLNKFGEGIYLLLLEGEVGQYSEEILIIR